MRNTRRRLRGTVALAAMAAAASLAGLAQLAQAQGSTAEEIAKYRQMLAEGNPAELWEAAGEELWKKPAGPKNASLEQCDLGKGPGVTKGAYAELPRYFKDANKVMDLEQRLAWCRVTLQGLTQEEATKQPFSASGKPSDIERLASYPDRRVARREDERATHAPRGKARLRARPEDVLLPGRRL